MENLTFTHQENKQTWKLNIAGSMRNVKTESIYKYIFLNASECDSSTANVNKYGQKGFKISPVSPIFCDSIILAIAVPAEKTKRQTEDGGGILQLDGTVLKIVRSNITEFFF